MPKLEADGRERCMTIYKESTVEKDSRVPEQTDASCALLSDPHVTD
jgi:hypothetical protein